MLSNLKNLISTNLVNLPGWRTRRKIIVLESDDWGSIRMSSKEAYANLLKYGVRVDRCPYNKYDLLESGSDLSALFDTLSSAKDSKGNYIKLTANTIVANPDFEKIAASGFEEYHYEKSTDTYKKYPASTNNLNLIQEGRALGIYNPQFHGREHVNVKYWMDALREGMEETVFAFNNRVFGISKHISNESRKSFLPALDFDTEEEIELHNSILKEGLNLFQEIFGYPSKSFVAPNYTWHPLHEPVLHQMGVKVIQGARAQQMPTEQGIQVRKHTMGSLNENSQVYLIRNVQFEPTGKPKIDWENKTFKEVATAFFYNKPAIISTHRLNFMGGMEESNREKNLQMLSRLFRKIVQKYPDVEFMTSDELGEMILNEKMGDGEY